MGRLEACTRPYSWETSSSFIQCLLVPLEGDRTRGEQLKTWRTHISV